jgi:putative hemolysin
LDKTAFMILGFVKLCAVISVCATLVSAADLPNPASHWCDYNGGKTETLRTDAGQVGICTLDRAQIEEWTLYRSTGINGPTQATRAFMQGDHAGPPDSAAQYCVQLGGVLETLLELEGAGETVFCKFPDYSMIEQSTLFRGPQGEGNERLAKILGR